MSYVPYTDPYAAGGVPPSADPYASTYGGGYSSYGSTEEVRTIFITGFPGDVKERELNNLLRFLPGYIAGQMNWKNGQAQGFALFDTGMAARQAIRDISGLNFDDGVSLRCEMARKNMYIRDDPAFKRARYSTTDYGPPMGGSAGGYGGNYGGPIESRPSYGGGPMSGGMKDNPPCNTLFIGNLGDNVSQEELENLFSNQPGYVQLKVLRNPKNTSCFVEFMDVPSATGAHTSHQGAILTSSDRGGIRIQYSKNPFGKKRDLDGNLIDTRPGVNSGNPPPSSYPNP